MATLRDIWDNVKAFGYSVKVEGRDGLREWQPLKEQYSRYTLPGDAPVVPVKSAIKDLSDQHLIIGKDKTDYTDSKFKITDTIILSNINPPDHFFIQHFRIPKMLDFSLTTVKLAQIAYNAGQYSAAEELGMYPPEVNNFYNDNILGDIETFISDQAASLVPSNLEQRPYPGSIAPTAPTSNADSSGKLMGGNNYYKYIKYKTKYLSLKHKIQ
ncbi:MAG: putative orfan [Hyperionvirus sp.]|uniref:Putative orfan n=1 Tax=Hyperionvirus sp. TaxID=2487770 RepID=A0A3G5A9F8_9VIRU|nr:MAG: putative orfan [Hyperionvirus sp.]